MTIKSNSRLDDTQPLEIAKNIWWVGFADYEAGFSNNPYLIVDEDEAVLIDPGPGHPIFRDIIIGKIKQIIPMEKIRFIVATHQDPDICGLIPYIENYCHPSVTILTHHTSAIFMGYYGVRKNVMGIKGNDILQLKSGRQIRFIHLPYIHSVGNVACFDEQTGSLFSSDLFASFNKDWSPIARDSDKKEIIDFIEQYFGSKKAVLFAYDVLKKYDIKRIFPQHGGVIDSEIDSYLDLLLEAEPGRYIRESENKTEAVIINSTALFPENYHQQRANWKNSFVNRHFVDLDSSFQHSPVHISFRAKVVVMMIDIRGFTGIMMQTKLEELMNNLHNHFDIITKVVNSCHGRVNKVLGDGLLVFFSKSNAHFALKAAELVNLAVNENHLYPIGIGFDYGEVILGDIGENARLDYTLIGTPVNFASRMCSLAKPNEMVMTDDYFALISKNNRETIYSLDSFITLQAKVKPADPVIRGAKFNLNEYNRVENSVGKD